jgi:hypothetical protein
MKKLRILAGVIAISCSIGVQERASAEETTGTLTLDGLSFISFGDRQVLALPAGSTVRFRFGSPTPSGSIPFTIRPEDVSIAPVALVSSTGTLRYSIASPASGSMTSTANGRQISFSATVRATVDSPEANGSFDYAIPFTTETTSASNLSGSETETVSGMRLVNGAWYGQIVGATTNKSEAFPEPGTAVYTVLSGSFDQVP